MEYYFDAVTCNEFYNFIFMLLSRANPWEITAASNAGKILVS